jgi:hypothetical protein
MSDAERDISTAADLDDLRHSRRRFTVIAKLGPTSLTLAAS